jgi:hypothetical protein
LISPIAFTRGLTSSRTRSILARLDRVFSNNDLNLAFPLASLSSLPRPTSDHTPLLLSLSTSLPKAGFFRFEKFWLHNQTFLPSILPAWEQAPVRDDEVGQLAACIKSTRSAAKVWSRRIRAPPFLVRNSQFLIQLFDYFEETRPLSSDGVSGTGRRPEHSPTRHLRSGDVLAAVEQTQGHQGGWQQHSVSPRTGHATTQAELHPFGPGQ